MRYNTNQQTCQLCGKTFGYNSKEDSESDESVVLDGRKMIIDEDQNMVPLYALPPDKRRLVNEKYIKFVCNKCIFNHLKERRI
jgi:hypothetical protein